MSNCSYVQGRGMVEERCAGTHLHEGRVQEALARLVDDDRVERLAGIFRALGDPTRVRIVSLLAGGELCVCDLAAALGMTQSAVSHQLRTLRDRGLVRGRRDGKQVFYTLDDEHVADLFYRAVEHVGHQEG
ncbi:MAG: helix-turn-helix transcriptional regulator [Anaerolineae bacterium]|nr:helix-turn-helix transcriptional regulator [Anaerolineae bacterium]